MEKAPNIEDIFQISKLPTVIAVPSNDTNIDNVADILSTPEIRNNNLVIHTIDSLDISQQQPKLEPDRSPTSHVDGGIAWAVLFGACLSGILTNGIMTALGLLIVTIKTEQDLELTDAAWIGAIFNSFSYTTAALVSPHVRIVGCRSMTVTGGVTMAAGFLICYMDPQIYVFYMFMGVVAGIGYGMVYSSCLIAVTDSFEKKRSIALVLLTISYSIGNTAFGPLYAILLDTFHLEGTLLITSAIVLNIAVGGRLFMTRSNLNKVRKDQKKDCLRRYGIFLDKELWNSSSFYLFNTFIFLSFISLVSFSAYFPDFLVEKGISLDNVSLASSFYGLTSAVGRGSFGICFSKIKAFYLWLFIFSCVAGGACLSSIPLCSPFAEFISTIGGYGFCSGFFFSAMTVIIVDLFGVEKLPACFGILNIVSGIASFSSGPLCGFVINLITTEGIVFYVHGCLLVLGGLVMIPTTFTRKAKTHEDILAKTIDVQRHMTSKGSVIFVIPDDDTGFSGPAAA